MFLRSLNKFLVGLSFLACSSAFAAPLTVDVSGIISYGELGDGDNTVLSYNVGAGSRVTGIAFDVNVTATDPSWLAELAVYVSDSDQFTGVSFNPGFAELVPGTGSYADSADLVALGLDFVVGADGILRLEFFEDFDDLEVFPDGIWNFGTITFEIMEANGPGEVPEPATGMLMGAGLALMGYTVRRRRASKQAA
jgi:hypothetical protein